MNEPVAGGATGPAGWNCRVDGHRVVCGDHALGPGETVTLHVTAEVGGQTLVGGYVPDKDYYEEVHARVEGTCEPQNCEDMASVQVLVHVAVPLRVRVTAPEVVGNGDQVIWTVNITNSGAGDARVSQINLSSNIDWSARDQSDRLTVLLVPDGVNRSSGQVPAGQHHVRRDRATGEAYGRAALSVGVGGHAPAALTERGHVQPSAWSCGLKRAMTKTGAILLAFLLLAACGGSTATAPSTTTPTTTFDETWTAESGMRLPNTTSTSTIRLPDNTYRTYYAGISTATSVDGLNWGNTALVVRSGQGEFNRNPAMFRTGANTFGMIYEQVVNNVGRFYRATSPDGVNFTVSPSTAVMQPSASDSNFLSVPDIISLGGGTIRMYFVAGGALTDSATSTDDGVTWTREGRITISGLSAANWVVDPELVRLSSGGYRMYFATGPDGQSGLTSKRIRSATSTDGRTFTLDVGIRVALLASGDDLVDPDVIQLPDGRYRMYYGYSTSGGNYNLMSAITSTLAAVR